jgi:hypothetical protein
METRPRPDPFACVVLSPFVPNSDPLLENAEVLFVGHDLNLDNGVWRGILAWAERFVKSEW